MAIKASVQDSTLAGIIESNYWMHSQSTSPTKSYSSQKSQEKTLKTIRFEATDANLWAG